MALSLVLFKTPIVAWLSAENSFFFIIGLKDKKNTLSVDGDT
jgi:hypothetical protein